jgi:hypothetical protein
MPMVSVHGLFDGEEVLRFPLFDARHEPLYEGIDETMIVARQRSHERCRSQARERLFRDTNGKDDLFFGVGGHLVKLGELPDPNRKCGADPDDEPGDFFFPHGA